MRKLKLLFFAALATTTFACGSNGTSGDSEMERLTGSWVLTAFEFGTPDGGIVNSCPGSFGPPEFPISCGADDRLNLNSDSTYSDTILVIPTNSGRWTTNRIDDETIIIFEDDDDEDDPQSYAYEFADDANTLIISKTVFGQYVGMWFTRD